MLPKKKRWMAVHTPSNANLVPPSHSITPVVGPKKLSGFDPTLHLNNNLTYRTNQMNTTVSLKNPTFQESDTGGMSCTHPNANVISDCNSPNPKLVVTTVKQSENVLKPTPTGRRNELNSNVISNIAQYPAELLQQHPGLLLQILPQEYLSNYAQNFIKLANTKVANDPSVVQNLSTQANDCAKMSRAEVANLQNMLYPLGVTRPNASPLAGCPSGSIPQPTQAVRTKFNIDNEKIVRNCQSSRSSPMLNTPMVQCSTPTSSQHFPPHLQPVISPDSAHNQLQGPKQQQTSSSLDFSSVARAASLLSPSQLEVAAALLSRWDSTNRNNLTVRNLSNQMELPVTLPKQSTQLSNNNFLAPNYLPDCLPGTNNPSENHQKRSDSINEVRSRKHSDPAFVTPTNSDPISIGNSSALRQSVLNNNQISLTNISSSQPSESTNHFMYRSLTPSKEHMWLQADQKSSHMMTPVQHEAISSVVHRPTSGPPNQSTLDLSDSRLTILHNAKLAAMSVDWPAPSSSTVSGFSNSIVPPPLPPSTTTTVVASMSNSAYGRLKHMRSSNSLPPCIDSKFTASNTDACSNSVVAQNQDQLNKSRPLDPSVAWSSTKNSFINKVVTTSTNNQSSVSIPISSTTRLNNTTNATTLVNFASDSLFANGLKSGSDVNVSTDHLSVKSEAIPPFTAFPQSCCPALLNHIDPQWDSALSTEEKVNPTECGFGPTVKVDNCHRKLSSESRSTQRSAMPLKKRLIQRYEADSSGLILKCEDKVHTDEIKCVANSTNHYSSKSGKNLTEEANILDYHTTTTTHSCIKKEPMLEGEACDKNHTTKNKRNKYTVHNNHVLNSNKNSLISKSCDRRIRKVGPKSADSNVANMGCAKPEKSEYDARNQSRSSRSTSVTTAKNSDCKVTATRRSRKHTTRCGESMRTKPNRRMAAVNGNLLMLVAARAHRSTSSGSSGSHISSSSSSSRSMHGGVTAAAVCSTSRSSFLSVDIVAGSETEQCPNSPTSSSSTKCSYSNTQKSVRRNVSSNSQYPNTSKCTSVTHSSISNNNGHRKPKRAAALAASAATSATAVLTAKRPRLMSNTRMKRKSKDGASTADVEMQSVDDEGNESVRTNEISSLLPLDNTFSSGELHSALMEENLNLEQLANQLPGPPDLVFTANKSLQAPNSLNFYKRSQRVFVQLVSCNDPNLKHVVKCRACRQLLRKQCNYSSADESACKNVNCGSISGSTETVTSTDSGRSVDDTAWTVAGKQQKQFKRPSGVRNSNSEKSVTSSKAGTKKYHHHHCEPQDDDNQHMGTDKNYPISVFCRFWGFRKLCFNNRGVLKGANFCHTTEADETDTALWAMHHSVNPLLDPHSARYILECASALYCRLLHEELDALNGKLHLVNCDKINHGSINNDTAIDNNDTDVSCDVDAPGEHANATDKDSSFITNKNGLCQPLTSRVSGKKLRHLHRAPNSGTVESLCFENDNHRIKSSTTTATSNTVATTSTSGFNAVPIMWKRPVKGVREMCDVCETTMFNTHWVCAKCGYSVCNECWLECRALTGTEQVPTSADQLKIISESSVKPIDPFPLKQQQLKEKVKTKQSKGKIGPVGWATCTTTRQHHEPNKLMLSALLPAGIIGQSLYRLHRIADHCHINLGCGCAISRLLSSNKTVPVPSTFLPVTSELNSESLLNPNLLQSHHQQQHLDHLNDREQTNHNSLDLLADLALKSDTSEQRTKMDEVEYGTDKSLSYSWICSSHQPLSTSYPKQSQQQRLQQHANSDPVIDTHKHQVCDKSHSYECHVVADPHKHRVLHMHSPDQPGSLTLFQSEWKRNHPVLISGCQKKFNPRLWTPSRFMKDFGETQTTLVDCANGSEINRYPLRIFWEGFEKHERRLLGKDGHTICLKLKDWPTTDDFAELQPERFQDLMSNLPMQQYTHRDGQLNLAARLTAFFVSPDLGPKLYVAYGAVGSDVIATTNLHIDIADAVNVMLYTGQIEDSPTEALVNANSVLALLRQTHADKESITRALNWLHRLQSMNNDNNNDNDSNNNNNNDKKSTTTSTTTTNTTPTTDTNTKSHGKAESDFIDIPGALWHIFLPEDAATLREFLTRVIEEETGAPIDVGSDPIHDQLLYLDQELLDRLFAFSGVQPCTLVQFYGDAIFIPAGAPHQVRNLNSCIKSAVDFVSPEHLPQCFQLIEEFRKLSRTHQNHEDKLQIKNMLFHTVKDCLSILLLNEQSLSNTEHKTHRLTKQQMKQQDLDAEGSTDQVLHHRTDGNSREDVDDDDDDDVDDVDDDDDDDEEEEEEGEAEEEEGKSTQSVDTDDPDRKAQPTNSTTKPTPTNANSTKLPTRRRTRGRPGRPRAVNN